MKRLEVYWNNEYHILNVINETHSKYIVDSRPLNIGFDVITFNKNDDNIKLL